MLENLRQSLTHMDPKRLQEHVFGTYITLRYGMAIMALLFPVLVYLSGKLSGLGLESSLSHYYWADTTEPNLPRTVFVGGLFALAALLYLYKGFTLAENVALNAAAVMAVLVALVPEEHLDWDPGVLHVAFAVTLFLLLVYVVWFRASDTLPYLPESVAAGPATKRYSRAWYQRRYRVIGFLMLLAPITAAILKFLSRADSYVFFIESAGVWAFAWYWLAKSSELERSAAIRRALDAQMAISGSSPGRAVVIAASSAVARRPSTRSNVRRSPGLGARRRVDH